MDNEFKLRDNHSYYRVNVDNTEIEYEENDVRRYGKDSIILLNDEIAIKYGDLLTRLDDQQKDLEDGQPKKSKSVKDVSNEK